MCSPVHPLQQVPRVDRQIRGQWSQVCRPICTTPCSSLSISAILRQASDFSHSSCKPPFRLYRTHSVRMQTWNPISHPTDFVCLSRRQCLPPQLSAERCNVQYQLYLLLLSSEHAGLTHRHRSQPLRGNELLRLVYWMGDCPMKVRKADTGNSCARERLRSDV